MRFTTKTWKLAVFVVVGLFALQAAAQTVVSGDITGTVTDPTGAVVSGATVTATSVGEGTSQSTTTSSAGLYRFPFAKPGAYKLTIAYKGFKGVSQTVTVVVGQIAVANFRLEVGSASETVEVTSGATLIQTEDANVSTNFSQIQLAELPAPGGDTTSYAYTTPGIMVSNGAGYGNFSSFGLPSTANLFTVNGNDNNDPFLNVNNSGASNLTLGANELQEISVVNNGYTAQYGRQAGAQVNSVTKSGSNGLHGNAFYGYNGTNLNANDWFNAGNPRPHAVNNNFYASVGGPIVKNKLFFFADYEGLRIVLPGASGLNYIPSPQFATYVEGNVPSAALPFYQNVFKLYAGAAGSQNATPVAGGACGDFDGTAGFGTGGTPCALQFTSNANNLITEWILATRVDYKISSKDSLFGRYHMDRGVQATGTDPINPVFNATSIQPEYDGQLNETHIFNPTTINNFIFAVTWYKALFGPPSMSAALAAFPTTMTFAGDGGTFSALGGTDNNYPQGRIPTQYQITDDFSKTVGGHDIKIGVNFRRDLVSDYSALAGTSGTLSIQSLAEFASGNTFAADQVEPLDPLGFGCDGTPPDPNKQPPYVPTGPCSNYSAPFSSVGQVRINYYSLGAYFQDQWKVSRKLSLTLAMRIDRNSNPVCKGCFARMSGPFGSIGHDANAPYNQTIQTGLNSAFSNVEKAVFSPRFGFAYSLDQNTVIRGGFGIFDDLYPAIAADRFLTNAPNVNSFGNVGAAESLAPGAGSVFADAAAANAAFVSGFAAGATLNDIGSPLDYYTMQNNLHNPKFAEWSLEVQRQIGSSYSVGLNYAGNHGYDIMTINPWLNAYCKTIACQGGQAFGGVIGSTPTDARFGEVVDLTNQGYSNYDGLTATFKMKPTKGFSGQFSYTWSHGLDTCSNNCLEPFVASNSITSLRYTPSPLLPGVSYGNSDYDVRHNLNLNYVYQSPATWSSPVLKHILGGWTAAGTLFYHTGLPWSPVDVASRSQLVNVLNLRRATPLATYAGAIPSASCGKSAAVYTATNGAEGAPCVTASEFNVGTPGFGNHSRNSLRGPGFFNTDLSISKGFKIGERFTFAVGATAFNLFNHQNFDLPANSVTSPIFGTIFDTAGSNTSPYGAFFGVPLNGRILQVHAKVSF